MILVRIKAAIAPSALIRGDVLKINRIKEIENYIIEKERATMEELCQQFGVSLNTIRRDINELERIGRIKKVYGGIILKDKKTTEPFETRQIRNEEAKQVIAQMASRLVEDGDIIYIDSGTTTMHMIPYLSTLNNITIITNSLNVIINSLSYPDLNVISTGGTLFRQTNSFIGIETVKFLKSYNFSKAFMATTAISIAKGVTNSSSFEYDIKKHVIQNCENIILLADSTKFDRASLVTYCNLEDINVLVTDARPADDYFEFLNSHHISLVLPSEESRNS